MKLPRPVAGEYHPAYLRYIERVTEDDVLQALESQVAEVRRALGAVPVERETWRYEPGKWSVRQVLGHVLDSERVFGFRMLSVARGETQPLPGFDEDAYAATAGHDRMPLPRLLDEFELLRGSHVALAKGLDEVAWARIGTANGHPIAPRALAYIMVGHPRHHLAVLASKYGIPA